jgi:hypothetical protein
MTGESMSDDVELGIGDKVRHRDAPEDAPVGVIQAIAGRTLDGAAIFQVAYRSPTGATSKMRYPAASLVLVERASEGA